MTDNFIQVNDGYILKVGIKDAKGNETGNYLEFDLMDTTLPLKLQEADKQHKKNYAIYCNKMNIVKKKEDHKGKYLLSSNQEEQIKIGLEFYEKEQQALDLFLGEGGTKKILNGRSFNEFTFNQIMDEIAPIIPLLKKNQEEIIKAIKEKYSTKAEDVLK